MEQKWFRFKQFFIQAKKLLSKFSYHSLNHTKFIMFNWTFILDNKWVCMQIYTRVAISFEFDSLYLLLTLWYFYPNPNLN